MNSPQLNKTPIDIDELTTRCMGKLELVDRVLTKFCDALDKELSNLNASLHAGDTAEIARQAHRIKGTSSTVSADGVQQCAIRLEASAATDEFETIEQAIDEMRVEFERVSQVVCQHRSGATP